MQGRTRLIDIAMISALVVALVLSGLSFTSSILIDRSTENNIAQQKTLSCSGDGAVKAMPDQVQLDLGVITQSPVAAKAVQDNAEQMNTVILAITGVGIARGNISTSTYNLYPIYHYDEKTGNQTLVGYKVQNTVTVKTSMLEKAGTIIDAATAAGANQVNSISFGLSEDTKNQLQFQALALACQNAKQNADTSAAALGLKITGIKTVNFGTISLPQPMSITATPSATSTPIFPGEQTLSVTIYVTYLIS